jgi:glycerol-3-phosphate dehydrogenase (NAD(P)+)
MLRHAAIVMMAKGIELGTGRGVSQMPAEMLLDHDPSAMGVLDGPTLARETMEGPPAASCIAVPDMVGSAELQSVLMGDTLRVCTSDDVVGCDVGAAARGARCDDAGAWGRNCLAMPRRHRRPERAVGDGLGVSAPVSRTAGC